MKKLKKLLRLLGLVLFLLLAVGGVSITGAAPVRPQNRDNLLTEQLEDPSEEQDGPQDNDLYQ